MKDYSSIFEPEDPRLLYDEWLVTNGLGGYACGSLGGAPIRKYNGLLIAALKAPLGRTLMLNYVADTAMVDHHEIRLSQLKMDQGLYLHSTINIGFRLENNLPIWTYQIDGMHLEKHIWMAHGQNTVYVLYHLVSSKGPIQLKWQPFFNLRSAENSVSSHITHESQMHAHKHGYEILTEGFPSLRLSIEAKNASFTISQQSLENVYYELEEKRGYDFLASLQSPGYFLTTLHPSERLAFIASTEDWNVIKAMNAEEAWIAEKQRRKTLLKASKPLSFSKTAAKLILAADQFIMTPVSREADMVRLKAMGEEAQSIIAGYPWFTDWGRDTMISLEGLTLTTGRSNIASAILRTFAYYIRDGLIPNLFPDGENQGLYHTADATLWFFHAAGRYIALTGDQDILEFLFPKFESIIDHHMKGTSFGIKMDKDGLLMQGKEGYQLTWMDAKVGDWVVTPRRGKTVEINALWYNALKLMESWGGKTSEIAKLCHQSFNQRFWYEQGQHLYDVVDGEQGDDPSLRPNQIFSISLPYPVLDQKYWKSVIEVTQKELLTAYGLRTLSPRHPDFKAYYNGNLYDRDAAYHQGTVWPWLIGPFIDAWLKVHPNEIEQAKLFLIPLEQHIDESCIGTINEIFDAGDPFHARGCIAQAWSVAEFLRCYSKLYPEFSHELKK